VLLSKFFPAFFAPPNGGGGRGLQSTFTGYRPSPPTGDRDFVLDVPRGLSALPKRGLLPSFFLFWSPFGSTPLFFPGSILAFPFPLRNMRGAVVRCIVPSFFVSRQVFLIVARYKDRGRRLLRP